MKYQRLLLKKFCQVTALFLLGYILPVSAEEEMKPVLVITPPGELFGQAVRGLTEELEQELSVTVLKIGKKEGSEGIERYFNKTTPKAVVIVGNRLLRLYASHLKKHPEASAIPVISIYALDTERALKVFENAIGISCQTPMVTAGIRFRGVVDKPIHSVGVIYRKAFKKFIDTHTKFCAREKITVKSIMVGDDKKHIKNEIKKALRQLIRKEKVDAVWIPNDNVILTSSLLGEVWMPLLQKSNIPVIVGVEVLVRPDLDFGIFAVIPDAMGIGIQAANLIFELMDEGWEIEGVKVYPTLSVYSVLNWKKAQEIYDTVDTRDVKRILGR